MSQIAFYIFSAIMLGFAVSVVVNRNPVSSALSLVVSFIGLAALFITLNAYFIGIIQILVYAGAVMVLFLFIIMLMDIKKEERRDLNLVAFGGGIAVTVAFVIMLAGVLMKFTPGRETMPALTNEQAQSDVKLVGYELFTNYNFHLQVIGVLLLVSTIGVVVLSRRATK
ncbi:MAG: NADH-quinone oxidoreductase subunit J [Verrucomicrobiales bacterium]